jgi:dTDP-4-amino-4,6-dideoxygalactose transaminase
VLEKQQFILGEPVAAFEKARRGGEAGRQAHAVGCSSGTDALWLAHWQRRKLGQVDAVVTTPFSFFASTSAILRAGATPVLADIEPATFNLNPG